MAPYNRCSPAPIPSSQHMAPRIESTQPHAREGVHAALECGLQVAPQLLRAAHVEGVQVGAAVQAQPHRCREQGSAEWQSLRGVGGQAQGEGCHSGPATRRRERRSAGGWAACGEQSAAVSNKQPPRLMAHAAAPLSNSTRKRSRRAAPCCLHSMQANQSRAAPNQKRPGVAAAHLSPPGRAGTSLVAPTAALGSPEGLWRSKPSEKHDGCQERR